MIALLIFSANISLSAECNALWQAAESVLAGRGIELRQTGSGRYETLAAEIALTELSRYIEENLPDKKPAWRQARYRLVIEIIPDRTDPGKTSIAVRAVFERFGVPDQYLLIPEAWMEVPSNDSMEEEILDAVAGRLARDAGGGGR